MDPNSPSVCVGAPTDGDVDTGEGEVGTSTETVRFSLLTISYVGI